MSAVECPGDGKAMEKKIVTKDSKHQGVDITYTSERYVCPDCGVEVADTKQAADIQRVMGDAYRKKQGLLTGDEIIEGRARLGLSQEDLARLTGADAASVKRWEKGLIQTRAMDEALRRALKLK